MSDRVRDEMRVPHQGMPPFDTSGPPVSYFEFWPQHFFYAPMVLYWLWLSLRYGGITLPTISNPLFPMGGWIGESKCSVFEHAGSHARQFIAPWGLLQRTPGLTTSQALDASANAGLKLPFIAKPDMGCRGAGVRRIRSTGELGAYIEAFPAGENILLQALADFEGEGGIFYIRKPNETRGQITSITLKYFPYVYGNGVSTLADLISADPRAGKLQHIYLPRHRDRLDWIIPNGQPFRIAYAGSHSRGTIFRNGNHLITEAMTDAFDRIAKDIKEFYFGRFDVRFASIAALQAGQNFTIVEVNGAGAEATHIWDRRTTLHEAYGALMQQYKALWEIGAQNAKRGFKPARLSDLIRAYRHERSLWAQYPLTE
ncbi:MAG: D-alanine--D-alanine ligase [Alphaproteobacteria bacterium]|nr:D-alanine--D-alanine ligase [Alphaproteobacteria bacterium]